MSDSTVAVDLNRFTCYCVDLDFDEVRSLMIENRWRELETLGVGHVCTGCRADYRLLKARLKNPGGLRTSPTDDPTQ
jgi:hypothetical protein